MNNQLADMIHRVSEAVEDIFRNTGEIRPMYEAVKPDGERMVVRVPGYDKDLDVALIKAFFAIENIDRYVYVAEAWTLETKMDIDVEQVQREGVRNHPDRREAVMFMAESRDGGILSARRYILRPEHGKAKLAPLHINDLTNAESSGRIVGLLK